DRSGHHRFRAVHQIRTWGGSSAPDACPSRTGYRARHLPRTLTMALGLLRARVGSAPDRRAHRPRERNDDPQDISPRTGNHSPSLTARFTGLLRWERWKIRSLRASVRAPLSALEIT